MSTTPEFRNRGIPFYNSEECLALPRGMYLGLFHGRKTLYENMDEWGDPGPTIGPLKYVHTTYGVDLKMEFDSDSESEIKRLEKLYFDRDIPYLYLRKDGNDCLMVEYEGMYYGDWTVYYHTPKETNTNE